MGFRPVLAVVFATVIALLTTMVPALAEGPSGPQSVAGLVNRLSPAVVNISSSHRTAGGSGVPYPKAPDGSPLNRYFDDLNPNHDQGGDAMDEAESLGSGFLISADGLIVTNNHVIDGADQVLIYLTDGTRLPAKIVGADTKTDLAVLKIDAKHPLPFVEFGDSDNAQVGDWVMAIGNPFGLGGTVTLGIVSARNRDIQSGPYDSYIQTDASINQGNSGGPLFDMSGKVVGINSAIIARGGASLGIGFAVPGNLAKPVVDQLAKFGHTKRGWLGVGIQDVTQDIAASIGRPDTHGAMVTDVTSPGPAAGVIEEGDIILEFDGKQIPEMRDLPRLVAETDVGKPTPVKIFRDGKEQSFTITLGELKDDQQAQAAKSNTTPSLPRPPTDETAGTPTLADLLGFEISPIDDLNRKTYALGSTLTGLVITSVKSGTDAYQKGVLTGFVVAEVNQHKVKTIADVKAIVDAAKEAGRGAILLKVTDPTGAGRYIGVKLAG
jgi:serine protease Do